MRTHTSTTQKVRYTDFVDNPNWINVPHIVTYAITHCGRRFNLCDFVMTSAGVMLVGEYIERTMLIPGITDNEIGVLDSEIEHYKNGWIDPYVVDFRNLHHGNGRSSLNFWFYCGVKLMVQSCSGWIKSDTPQFGKSKRDLIKLLRKTLKLSTAQSHGDFLCGELIQWPAKIAAIIPDHTWTAKEKFQFILDRACYVMYRKLKPHPINPDNVYKSSFDENN